MTQRQKCFYRLTLVFCLLILPVALFIPTAVAQTITGSVSGTVTDATGAVILNAKVTATNVETGVSTTTMTNSRGLYELRFLQIGRYKVTTEAQGFSKQVTSVFSLEVQQEARIDVKESAAGDVQAVTVTDIAAILNTENPTTGTTITAAQATELPVQARNFTNLTSLAPGAVQTTPSNANSVGRPTYNSGTFVNGNREQDNNYTLDGVDINDAIDNYINYEPNLDAIGELHIITGNATAEYGNANGGQIVMVTKSGTNHFHGDAFWFLENDKMNANSWTNKHNNPANPGPVPQLNRSIFGGTIGGPILRDRLFFFGDYQGARQHNSTTEYDSVATAAMRAGYAPLLGQTVPIINPVATYMFAHPDIYPLPNVTTSGATPWVNDYAGTAGTATKNDQGDVKVDGKLSNKDNLSGRFTIGRETDGDTKVSIPTRMAGVNSNPYTGFAINWTRVLSSNIVNEARVGFSRGRFINLIVDLDGKLGSTGNANVDVPGTQLIAGMSAFNIAGAGLGAFGQNPNAFGNAGVQTDSLTNAYTYGDNVSWQLGRQTLKFGLTAIRYQSNRNFSGNDGVLGHFDYNGTYSNALYKSSTSDSWADFLLNQASAYGQGSYLDRWGQREWRDAFFVQDDWKVNPRLTINLGVRWEWDQPLYEVHNKQANVNIYTGAVSLAGVDGASRALYNSFWNGYMPRIGFAYSPASLNNKFVVRGGYGITNFLEGTGANLRLPMNPPYYTDAANQQSGTSAFFQVQGGYPLPPNATTFAGNIRAWSPNFRPALVQQFNLTTETQLDSNTALVIAYLGQDGNHLTDPREPNQRACPNCPLPVTSLPGMGLVTQVSYTESEAMMNYNSLQVTLRRHLAHGLEFLSNYTYSKGLTNSLGYYGGTRDAANPYWQNAFNGSADYGPTFFDAKHIFTFSGYYDLPFGRGRTYGSNINRALDEVIGGWKLGTIANLHSGFPLTISSPSNYAVNNRGSRGNQYRKLIVKNRSVNDWFGTDPSATPCGVNINNSTCAYGQESTTGFGTASPGSEYGPGFKDLDANLSKSFAFTQTSNLQFRANFYNVLNTVSLQQPDTGSANSTFGQITKTLSTERQIELALKLTF